MRLSIRTSVLCSVAIAALASASPSLAVTGGPPIAYALTSGNTQSIYLANPDGTGTVKVYTGGSKVNIVQIDIRPGGNQMAILESSIAGGQGILKIINYTDAGANTGVTTIDSGNCQNLGVDYHPTDGSLLVSRYCNKASIIEARQMANGVFASTPLVTLNNDGNSAAGYIRWLGDGSGFLWAFGHYPTGAGVERHMLSNPYAPTVVYQTGSLSLPSWLDVAHCSGALDASCSKMLVTTPQGILHLVTFDDFGGIDQGALFPAYSTDGHYSPDNTHVLWRYQTRSYQLMIDNKIFVKGSGAKDWRQ